LHAAINLALKVKVKVRYVHFFLLKKHLLNYTTKTHYHEENFAPKSHDQFSLKGIFLSRKYENSSQMSSKSKGSLFT